MSRWARKDINENGEILLEIWRGYLWYSDTWRCLYIVWCWWETSGVSEAEREWQWVMAGRVTRGFTGWQTQPQPQPCTSTTNPYRTTAPVVLPTTAGCVGRRECPRVVVVEAEKWTDMIGVRDEGNCHRQSRSSSLASFLHVVTCSKIQEWYLENGLCRRREKKYLETERTLS